VSVNNRIAAFNGTTGITLADSGATVANIDPRGKQSIWVPAGAWTLGAAPVPSAGVVAPGGTLGAQIKTIDFDTTTEEYAYFSLLMPKSWNVSTFTFQAIWSHAATVTNFGVLYAVAASDTDSLALASGTAQRVTDTGGTTNVQYITAESAAITPSNTPVAGDTITFRVNRVPADAADTLAIDMRLHGVMIYYTTNAPTDV
jgi:hypothetical protein